MRPLIQIILLILWIVAAANCRQLLQLTAQFRHGARTEPFVSETILNWDDCVLSTEGALMAINLGKFIRQKYSSFIPDAYDASKISANSTNFERTIRTGIGALRGIFDDAAVNPPFMWHIPEGKDFTMAYYYSWPAARLREDFINSYNERTSNDTLKILNRSELAVIGRELGCEHLCSTQPTTCALLGEDVTACRLSNGKVSQPLLELLPKLKLVQAASNSFLYQYNRSDPYWADTGPYARMLVEEYVKNSRRALRNGTHPLLQIYSVHDITIYGFFVAIGVINSTTSNIDVLVPPFASVLLTELYDDGNLRVVYAVCNQTYGSNHEFHEVPIQMGCGRIDGKNKLDVYYSDECPVDDVERYLDTTMPLAPDPKCAALPADLEEAQCDVEDGRPPTTDACLAWRSHCPQHACNGSYVLDISNFACVCVNCDKSRRTVFSAIAAAAVAVGSILIGFLAGIFIRRCQA